MHTQNMITLGHHFVIGVGNIGGLYIGGFFGSMSQLTWISECSTFFVNFGQILAWHEKTESNAYLVNGISMLVSFFIFRVLFYTYMIFWGVIPFDFVDSEANWKLYPQSQHYFIFFLQFCYLCMYFLNLYWFWLILSGVLKAVGLMKDDGVRTQSTPKKCNDVF